MGKKIIEDIPATLTVLYKSHIPSLSVIPVTVNAIHFHKGNGTFSNRDNYSLELLDPDGTPLPRMVCEKMPNGSGYLIKNNLHLDEADAYKRLAKNVKNVINQDNPEIEKVDREVIFENLEIIKDRFPHYLI